jgi:hypothetical protein
MWQSFYEGLFTGSSNIISRSKSFRRSAKIVFLHGAAGRCGGAEMQFLHSGTAVKPYPGKLFDLLIIFVFID